MTVFYYRDGQSVYKRDSATMARELSPKEVEAIQRESTITIYETMIVSGRKVVCLDDGTLVNIQDDVEIIENSSTSTTTSSDLINTTAVFEDVLSKSGHDIDDVVLDATNIGLPVSGVRPRLPGIFQKPYVFREEDLKDSDPRMTMKTIDMMQQIQYASLREDILTPRPYFVFDGADFVGKTTFLKQFQEFMKSKSFSTTLVREPGETAAGAWIRQQILSSNLGPDVNLELFIADRILTQQIVIKPALQAGSIVISDRSLLSTVVYQGFPNNRQDEVIRRHKSIPSFLMPTHGFVCLLDYEICQQRAKQRSNKAYEVEGNNHFDQEKDDAQRFRHNCYTNASSWAPFPITYLDFSKDYDTLNHQVLSTMMKVLR